MREPNTPPSGRASTSTRARFVGIGLFALSVLGYVGLHARRAVPTDEVERLHAWAQAEAATYPRGSCERPVLRGEARVGSGSARLGALLSRTGPGHACFAALSDETHDALAFVRGWVATARHPDRPLLADERALPPVCDEVVRELREAVAHRSVCSPFPPGGVEPDERRLRLLPSALAIVARERVRRGRLFEAAELLLDGLRATDDLVRGGAGERAAQGATRASRLLRAHLDEILAARLSAVEVRAIPELEARTRRLTEQVARLVEDRAGEARYAETAIVDWMARRESAGEAARDDVRALHYRASRDLHARLIRDCPAEDRSCHRVLRRFATSAPAAAPSAIAIALLGRKVRRAERLTQIERSQAEGLANDALRFTLERGSRVVHHFALVDRVAGCTSAPPEPLEADRPADGFRYVWWGRSQEPFALARISGCPEP